MRPPMQPAVRAGEIGPVNLDMVAVVRRQLGCRFAEHQPLRGADLDPGSRLAIGAGGWACMGSKNLAVETRYAFRGARRYVQFELRDAELNGAKTRVIGLVAA